MIRSTFSLYTRYERETDNESIFGLYYILHDNTETSSNSAERESGSDYYNLHNYRQKTVKCESR